MVQLELDKTAEAALARKAHERGLRPEQLAAELIKTGLCEQVAGSTSQEARQEAINALRRNRQGQTLGLDGMSLRELAHLDHKY